jgi:hypothetical protein
MPVLAGLFSVGHESWHASEAALAEIAALQREYLPFEPRSHKLRHLFSDLAADRRTSLRNTESRPIACQMR